jgi:hypothetical protein
MGVTRTPQASSLQKSSGFDAIGVDAVFGAVQLVHALHPDGRRSRALDIRPHGHQQGGQVGYLGLASTILHHCLAFSQNRCHEQVFCPGDGDLVEHDVGAVEFLGACFQITVLLHDGRPHRFQSLEVKIDWPITNRASARLGHAREPTACDQRAQNQR